MTIEADELREQEPGDNGPLKAFDAVKRRLEVQERDSAEGWDGEFYEVVECKAECADLFVTRAEPELAALTALEQEPLLRAIEIATQWDAQKFVALAGDNMAAQARARAVIAAAHQIRSEQSIAKAAIIHWRARIDDISAETEKPSMGGHRLSVQIKYKLNSMGGNADHIRLCMNGMAAHLAKFDDLLTRDGKAALANAEAMLATTQG